MEKYYPVAEQEKYGVVGIELEKEPKVIGLSLIVVAANVN